MKPSPILSRRSALKPLAGTAAITATAASLHTRLGAEDTAAGGKGNVNHSVCKWCYPDISLDALCTAGKEFGLKSVELLSLDEIPTVQKHGLTCAMVSGIPGGIGRGLNRLENHDTILQWFEQAAPKAADLGTRQIICFSGDRKGLDDQKGIENCAIGIKRLLPIAEKHRITLVMELLNSRVNHPDYQCDRTAWGVEVCKRVASPRVKLLYDIYHMQIMEGDVIRTIRDNYQWIGHFHTAGNPGRNELSVDQEINYKGVAKAIADLGYKGFLCHEYTPKVKPWKEALLEAVEACNV